MNHCNISLLIPSTTKGRNWHNIKDTYLYNLTLKTFLLTRCKKDYYSYTVYIGHDDDDAILTNSKEQREIYKFNIAFPDVSFEFVSMKNIKKGHLTAMWNKLFVLAYNSGNDYFYQCGDDINFKTTGWVTDSIDILEKNRNIGITGPINNNHRILTQTMVSRKHMDIFGFFFPEEIENWCCDDWYNYVYQPTHFFPLNKHYCVNEGGKPRYIINNDINFTNKQFAYNVQRLRENTRKLAEKHKKLICDHIL